MLLALTLCVGLGLGVQEAANSGSITSGHVRGTDESTRAIIAEGRRRSATFGELVGDLERSNYIVYVEAVATLRNGMKGALLHGSGAKHMLRVHLRVNLPHDEQIAVLAHELQHVREVAQAGITADPAEMELLFRRIGGRRLAGGRRQQFETDAALRAGDQVAADLRKRPQ